MARRVPLQERFWTKVAPAEALDCWLWTATTTPVGYGHIKVDGRNKGAHRVAWELLRGEIPTGLVVDHLCRVRNSVNPWHMELVTSAENTRRGIARCFGWTECQRGHAYTPENTRYYRGGRHCRECRRITARNYTQRSRPVTR